MSDILDILSALYLWIYTLNSSFFLVEEVQMHCKSINSVTNWSYFRYKILNSFRVKNTFPNNVIFSPLYKYLIGVKINEEVNEKYFNSIEKKIDMHPHSLKSLSIEMGKIDLNLAWELRIWLVVCLQIFIHCLR